MDQEHQKKKRKIVTVKITTAECVLKKYIKRIHSSPSL